MLVLIKLENKFSMERQLAHLNELTDVVLRRLRFKKY